MEAVQKVWEVFFTNKKDIELRNTLIEHYLPFVKYTAERVHSRLPKNVVLDDIISAGILGLIDAIDKFDPVRAVKFETYCVRRIKGSILDDIRKSDWIPRLVRTRANQLRKVTEKLEASYGRQPTETEMAKELELDMKSFHRLQHDANAVTLISLNNGYFDSDGGKDTQEINTIEDKKSQDPLFEVEKRDMKDFFTKGFSIAEKLIITLYYYEEMTMKEIGKTLDLSESRVSQINSSVLERLKAHAKTIKKNCNNSHESQKV